MTVRRLLAISILTWISSSAAFACICRGSGARCPELGSSAGPVFVGTVLQVTKVPVTNRSISFDSRKAHFHVDEAFGGIPADASEIDVFTGQGGGDCGFVFIPGEVYLVQGSVAADGSIHTSICHRTRLIQEAVTEVRILRLRRDGQSLPSVAGRIVQRDWSFNGRGLLAPRALPNALVRLKSEAASYETSADEEGYFTFSGVHLGVYEFAPVLPLGTARFNFVPEHRDFDSVQVASACEEHDIYVAASGSIQGRVLDSSNNPLLDVDVYIVPNSQVERPQDGYLYSVVQDDDGSFHFDRLPPGDYLVLVNPDDRRSPEFPYRRTFYPDVHDRGLASIITVHAGEHVKDVDIRLRRQFETRHIRVAVLLANGQSVTKDAIVMAEALGSHRLEIAIAVSDQTVRDLVLVPDESYEVQAELVCRLGTPEEPGEMLKSKKILISPADGQTKITLTMPDKPCPAISDEDK